MQGSPLLIAYVACPQAADEVVLVTASGLRAHILSLQQQSDQLEKRCHTLRDENTHLSDECSKLDAEIQDKTKLAHIIEERNAEVSEQDRPQ